MDKKIEAALRGVITGIAAGKAGKLEEAIQPGPELQTFYRQLEEVFNMKTDFLVKLRAFDELFESQSIFSHQQEILFDLLLINFFSQDAEGFGENYLETPEWEAIEDETVDRGTELLNIILYLRECQENDIDPSLDDFLKEFLLVEEEEFQDEHEVYEEVIAGQMLMESSYEEISRAAAAVREEAEIKEIFYPLMSFFYDTDPSQASLQEFFKHSHNKIFDSPVLFAILAYHNGLSLWKQ
ncbi:hypothetical protein EDD80_103156 [Anseongella ginsenosidimutans]|uniref:Uncharacterized protein n=1 Tax=Anseongella ginsenosidimutans TaxID=496056 RepID=A0A4R3KU20_9SPHI|nr:hypothetical protein [Anseongella ginsenosidimutans]QEC53402.1 hypothetical protein FRZ59_14360 [Anseongella ginsenosidimutans]TCS88293.1 hypothetical protein EDD80_103156 [Anseongella ginsenosidimutans]